MIEAGLDEVTTYVARCQNTGVQLIITRPIMYLFLAAERRPRAQVFQWWWEQDNLGLGVMQVEERATHMEEEEYGYEKD